MGCSSLLYGDLSNIAPKGLPLKFSEYEPVTRGAVQRQNKVILPEALKAFPKEKGLDVDLSLDLYKGKVAVVRPLSGKTMMGNAYVPKVWDKLFVPEKSELKLKAGRDISLVIGAGSVAQVLSYPDGRPRMRLFKGKMRIDSPLGEEVSVETLNAHSLVSKGKVDIKISAMNTLVAPREGEDVEVLTQKANRSVSAGTYGLVMADGSIVFAGKGK